jgi:non-ribosomal peptide synthetase component F
VFSQLKSLIVGRGALDPRVVGRVLKEHRPGRLLIGYGPTESTTFALAHAVDHAGVEGTSIPLGRPVGDTRVYVLDEHQELSPVGAAGEIYVGGDGLALGYLRQPARTAERFLPDPFGGAPASRMYRTGDLGRWLGHGAIEFLGRDDGT